MEASKSGLFISAVHILDAANLAISFSSLQTQNEVYDLHPHRSRKSNSWKNIITLVGHNFSLDLFANKENTAANIFSSVANCAFKTSLNILMNNFTWVYPSDDLLQPFLKLSRSLAKVRGK